MQRALFMRRLPIAALTAAAAIAAHGGPGLLRSPTWQAAVIATALLACAAAALTARLAGAVTFAPTPSPFWLTAAAMLAAQLAAHELLLQSSVHSGAGTTGTLALHVAVALIAAVVVHRGQTRTVRHLRALAAALRAQLESVALGSVVVGPPRVAAVRVAVGPRAPPRRF